MQSDVHNETVCAARKDSDYSFTAVPSDARKGIISLLAVMVGFSFTSSSMVTGAKMGLNSDLLNFIYALCKLSSSEISYSFFGRSVFYFEQII